MKLVKLAVAGVLSAFLFTSVQAAPAVMPASKITSDSVIQLAQEKKKAAAKKKAAPKKKVAKKAAPKKAAKKKAGPGKCGTMSYYNMKTKKCTSKG